MLIGHATQFEPGILRRLGDRVLAHINPDLADQRLRDRLDREQRHAQQRRGFTLSPDGLGGIRLSGVLDVEGAAIIDAAIGPLSAPTRDASGPDLRTPAARRADALVDVCQLALRTGELPAAGGQPPQLNVTIDLDALQRDVAVGQFDTGALLTPAGDPTHRLPRRRSCPPSSTVPVCPSTSAAPAARSPAPPAPPSCSATAAAPSPAVKGHPAGPTSTTSCSGARADTTDRDNGVALCRHHHRLIHTTDWTIRLGPDRHPEFIPPRHIDPTQQPRRNPYHQRR